MELDKRFRCEALRDRVMSAEEAALLIRDGENVAVSGFTPSGCPKAVPLALARQVRDGERKLRLGLFSGASTGEELDSAWAEQDIIARRLPYMTSKALRTAVNGGSAQGVAYTDLHLGMVAQNARYGFYGPIQVAIIEAAAITEEGHLIPTTAVGCSQTWIDLAEQVIVELNLRQPAELEGFHDIYRLADPPARQPIPLTDAAQRIGLPYLLKDSDFTHLRFFSEVMQDGILDLMDAGKADMASATSLSLSEAGMRRLLGNLEAYRGKLLLRDSEISNSAEVIRRLGVIAMNTAVEVDLYGNVNSSQMNGTSVYNGIGGSGDYARNAAISIFMTNSVAKNGKISSIVPMVSHVDHTEHDVDVIVTEQGWADLRGLSPKQRAVSIIENCAHPDYREQLRAYFEDACAATRGAQTPHLLDRCFAFHRQLKETGSMRLDEEK